MKLTRNHLLIIATAAVWIIAYSAWTADWMAGGMNFLLERALRRIPVCLFGAACCWTMKVMLDWTAGYSLGRRLAAAIGLCVLASLVQAVVNALVFYVIAPRWGPTGVIDTLQNAAMLGWVFLAWAGLYFAIDSDASAQEASLRLADAQTAAQRARNQALAQQISPHFLFNALNTLSGLILEKQFDRAEKVTMSIAAVLRRSLEAETRDYVPLREELEAVERYLDIEQNRFGGRLEFTEQVAPNLWNLAVPPMILQPLVENAIKHGVARSLEPVRLALSAEVVGEQLRIKVVDDAIADRNARPAAGQGIGHPNIRQRLTLLYGDDASMTCLARRDGGYSAEIRIPADSHAAA